MSSCWVVEGIGDLLSYYARLLGQIITPMAASSQRDAGVKPRCQELVRAAGA
jgi:hypothetical protein